MTFKIQLRDHTKTGDRFVVPGEKATVRENGRVFAVLAPGVWESAVRETESGK